jgi:asparagine synthase (glutamine-hydrolysing)
VTSFSVTSRDPASNEEEFIDLMGAYAGCQVYKVQIDQDPLSLLRDLGQVCWYSDQPVGGFSAVAHQRMMQGAHERGITVLLTGQGSDEQLGGYNKLFYFYMMDRIRSGGFSEAAGMMAGALREGTILGEFTWSEASRYLPLLRKHYTGSYLGDALRNEELAHTGLGRGYREREWRELRNFSVPMLLHYEDRMSMSIGKEMRLPFLDYRVAEFLAGVPACQKLHAGWTKHLLRLGMEGHIPEAIRWRRDKKGFNVPEQSWARNEFRETFSLRFQDDMLAGQLGLIKPAQLRVYQSRYDAKDRTATYKGLFTAYCLETWLREFEPSVQF